MKKLLVLFLIIAVGLLFTAESDAKKKKKKAKYKVIEVTDGGSISGKALFDGANPPKDGKKPLTSEQDLCGNEVAAEEYIISGNKEIKNVVVYLAKIKAGKAIPKDKALVDNVLCYFVPHVSVGFQGNEIDIRNSDPVFHNVHSYIKKKTVYNLGLPDKGSVVTKKMKRAGIMSVKCDSHPWMLGYVFISKHPYAVVTNETGDFSLTDIPAGSYEVKAWHEAFGEISLGNVDVAAGKTAKVNAKFK